MIGLYHAARPTGSANDSRVLFSKNSEEESEGAPHRRKSSCPIESGVFICAQSFVSILSTNSNKARARKSWEDCLIVRVMASSLSG